MAQRKTSAGLLMYRCRKGGPVEFYLAHPGGPYYTHRDEGCWSIPKGEADAGEDLLRTAVREFEEETGIAPAGPFLPLGAIRQKGGKIVHAWAFSGTCDESHQHRCNTFKMEWPPGSGCPREFPEVDRAAFFPAEEARKKLKASQVVLIDRLLHLLEGAERSAHPPSGPGPGMAARSSGRELDGC